MVDLSEQDVRERINLMADYKHEWAGIPIPIEGYRLKVEDRYPFKGIETIFEDPPAPADPDAPTMTLRNAWYSESRQGTVWIYQVEGEGVKVVFDPKNRSSRRLDFWMMTMGVSPAWTLEVEAAAISKLAELIKPHLLSMYLLTGTFMESSKRSGVTYIFRKNRPTIAVVPSIRGDDEAMMRPLCTLCLHPIGYYQETWAGAMCPTDDVIAHLVMMRGDEHFFWRRANQHPIGAPEAGV